MRLLLCRRAPPCTLHASARVCACLCVYVCVDADRTQRRALPLRHRMWCRSPVVVVVIAFSPGLDRLAKICMQIAQIILERSSFVFGIVSLEMESVIGMLCSLSLDGFLRKEREIVVVVPTISV